MVEFSNYLMREIPETDFRAAFAPVFQQVKDLSHVFTKIGITYTWRSCGEVVTLRIPSGREIEIATMLSSSAQNWYALLFSIKSIQGVDVFEHPLPTLPDTSSLESVKAWAAGPLVADRLAYLREMDSIALGLLFAIKSDFTRAYDMALRELLENPFQQKQLASEE